MNIIFGEAFTELPDQYTVLELDQLRIPPDGKIVTSYCVLETVPLDELPTVEHYKKLHNDCIQGYREQQWNFCKQAIEALNGRWNRELDSFYAHLLERITKLENQELSTNWDWVIDKN